MSNPFLSLLSFDAFDQNAELRTFNVFEIADIQPNPNWNRQYTEGLGHRLSAKSIITLKNGNKFIVFPDVKELTNLIDQKLA